MDTDDQAMLALSDELRQKLNSDPVVLANWLRDNTSKHVSVSVKGRFRKYVEVRATLMVTYEKFWIFPAVEKMETFYLGKIVPTKKGVHVKYADDELRWAMDEIVWLLEKQLNIRRLS